MEAKPLANRTVVVVGAGASGPGWGNGNACAVTYARAGASVVCADLDDERVGATVALIEAEGGRALGVSVDATVEADVTRAVSTALERFGRVDVMHNNVGGGGRDGAPDEVDQVEWERLVALNLTSAYLGIRCAVPPMRRQGGGSIITTSSLLAARVLRRPTVPYSVAKAGVETLTQSCAAAYGRENIRVNCIRIGFSETPTVLSRLLERGIAEADREMEFNKTRAKVPLNAAHGDPFDVARAALFLASDAARHLTGVVLPVDGGLSVAPI